MFKAKERHSLLSCRKGTLFSREFSAWRRRGSDSNLGPERKVDAKSRNANGAVRYEERQDLYSVSLTEPGKAIIPA